MYDISIFENELTLIKSELVRSTTERLLRGVPAYFWQVPASSSGKYHPSYAIGDGGLVRHVKAAVRFAAHLFVVSDFTDDEKDAVVAALLLHDAIKHGNGEDAGTTVHEHPILAAEYIRKTQIACMRMPWHRSFLLIWGSG